MPVKEVRGGQTASFALKKVGLIIYLLFTERLDECASIYKKHYGLNHFCDWFLFGVAVIISLLINNLAVVTWYKCLSCVFPLRYVYGLIHVWYLCPSD